jgi:hypothetical protein
MMFGLGDTVTMTSCPLSADWLTNFDTPVLNYFQNDKISRTNSRQLILKRSIFLSVPTFETCAKTLTRALGSPIKLILLIGAVAARECTNVQQLP